MIEESLVESARLIRNEFMSLNKTLSVYEEDVRNLATYFFKISEELKNIGSEISPKDTIETIKDKVMNKLSDLEVESDKVSEKIEKVNIQLEKLKKEEVDLHLVIKKRYPSLSDDEIKIEIQRRIN